MKATNRLKLPETALFDDYIQTLPANEQDEVEMHAQHILMMDSLVATRKKLGITQAELSKRSGVPRPTISKIERGKRNATVNTLMSLAHAMGKRLELKLA